MTKRNDAKDWFGPLIQGLDTKGTITLKDQINGYVNYWFLRIVVCWLVCFGIIGAVCFGWWAVSLTGFCEPLEITDYSEPILILYCAFLMSVGWLMGFQTLMVLCNKHIREINGITTEKKK